MSLMTEAMSLVAGAKSLKGLPLFDHPSHVSRLARYA